MARVMNLRSTPTSGVGAKATSPAADYEPVLHPGKRGGGKRVQIPMAADYEPVLHPRQARGQTAADTNAPPGRGEMYSCRSPKN